MKTLGDRIKEVRKTMSIAEFCKQFKIHKNTLAFYENNKRKPDASFLISFCNTFQISANWLLLGSGPKKWGEDPTAPVTTVDKEILIDAIASLEEALQIKNRVMKPEAKAEIISEIYTLIGEDEQGNLKDNLAKLLRLVA